MRVALNWLLEFVDLPTRDPAELGRVLAMLGHEVEGIEHLEAGWNGVVIARVETVEPHPKADRVRVCTVTTGGDPITVVCGAWNFEAGAVVAFAPPGAVLPGDFEIGVRTIRGVESNGMICSEKELELGDDAEGILVLSPEAPVGKPLEEVVALPDTVFDLTITPNRPDAMSILGIARDLAAWYDIGIVTPRPEPDAVGGDPSISVRIEDPHGNPRFVARQVDGVDVRPSPLWMRTRLRAAGLRPISNLVDVTNYVMMELGQPLHVFDVQRIAGNELMVRRAQAGETLRTLDGVDRVLSEEDLVICDADGPTSLAGTMGGERSEVSERTSSVLIEAASWDPPTVMYMSRRHQLRSEASARFERGVDPQLPPLATARAAELILDLAGGQARAGIVDVVARPLESPRLQLTIAEVARILGPGFDADRVTALLERLGFEVTGRDPLSVLVPSYRPDVTRPVDLIEEVARLADYDTFGEELQLGAGGGLTDAQVRGRTLRRVLASIGYSQAVTLPFVMPSEVDAFRAPEGHDLTQTVRVLNPLSEEESVLRPALLPGLLRVLRQNRNRGQTDVAAFEIGRVFRHRPWSADKRVPEQPTRLAMAATGSVGPRQLAGSGKEADVHAIVAAVSHLAVSLGLDLEIEQGSYPGFHPARTSAIRISGEVIGHAGELHPTTARVFDLHERVAVCELDLDPLLEHQPAVEFKPVSPFPPADFDLSFEVAGDTSAGDLLTHVRTGGGDLVESVRVFDEFTGPGLGDGQKALAIRVRLRAPDRTLGAEEIARARQQMIDAAAAIGARLRGSR